MVNLSNGIKKVVEEEVNLDGKSLVKKCPINCWGYILKLCTLNFIIGLVIEIHFIDILTKC